MTLTSAMLLQLKNFDKRKSLCNKQRLLINELLHKPALSEILLMKAQVRFNKTSNKVIAMVITFVLI